MNAPLTLAAEAVLHPYPLIRGGGLFLLCVGLGFLLGWIFQSRWIPFAIGGGVAGFVASGLSALLPSLGPTSFVQIAGLVGSFVLEMGLIYLVISSYQKQPEAERDDRQLILRILFVVGLHFLTMGLAHGPLMTLLGALTSVNALIGLYVARRAPVRALGVSDAVLKLGFGAWMLLAYPAVTFG
ncbi:hypothetical protein GCM10010329_33240 [Streptomyces spiroverticillatus]|uniref:Uncharacterized protein n=1 Tax=Streptomyces finlayi TaxID=67296 RepID=A0A918WWP3_9ACTN|nr:DUF6609 family protein [Streptomyces finlayi]GHA07849.1 hypothetical protein GCM10010329_33240 [Streptomyces spiroverticillatus]GHC91033.1 hypothetical protein GCM10010334_25650 [Streptomyces finlayi]